MTINEMYIVIESNNKKKKQQLKEKAIFDYRLADLIAISVWRKTVDSFPEIHKVYPELFEAPKDNSWIIIKENFKSFAKRHNKEVGFKNDTRRITSKNKS